MSTAQERYAPGVTPAALSVDQAAAYLGISRRTLYKISAERGQRVDLVPVCIAGRRLFRRVDLDAYLASRVGAA